MDEEEALVETLRLDSARFNEQQETKRRIGRLDEDIQALRDSYQSG